MAKTKVKSREEQIQEAWLKYFKNVEKINDFKRILIEYYKKIEPEVEKITKYNIQLWNIEKLQNEQLLQYIESIKKAIDIAKEKLGQTEKYKDISSTELGSLDKYREIINHYSNRLKKLKILEQNLPYSKPKMEQNKFNSLKLENFKGFSENNEKGNIINIKPITLIYGPNSYGKSSILQSLLLLNQTTKDGGDYKTVCLLPKGEMVNLGSFKDLINKHAKNQEIIIELSLPSNHYFNVNTPEAEEVSKLTELFFSFHFGLKEEQIVMSQIDIYRKQTDYTNILKPIKKEKELIYTYKLRANLIYEKKCQLSNNENRTEEISKLSFFRLEEFIAGNPFEQLEEIIKEIVYVSSFRQPPERYYVPENNKRDYVGKNGEYTSEILYDSDIHKYVDYWLGKIAHYKLPKRKHGSKVNSIILNDDTAKVTNINLLDLGSGIAQVLPIITQAFKSEYKMILIEEPEIHLHPKAQAELGEMFVDAAKERHNTFIIETHSENLLLRLQKLIRHGELSKDDVSVIYVNKDENGSHCIPLNIDEEGDIINIDDIPDGFFEEGFNELFDIGNK